MINAKPKHSYGRRRVDNPRPVAFVEPATVQWAEERAAYDKTAKELGHRPWGGYTVDGHLHRSPGSKWVR